MTNILILGATGSLAQTLVPVLLQETDAHLTLFSRSTSRLHTPASDRIKPVQGDVMDLQGLTDAMRGHDIVYAGLAGRLEPMAKNVVAAMQAAGVKRLIWISSMGIYGETGEDHGSILDPYRQSAAVVEGSALDWTIIRPGWFTSSSTIDYQLTQKGQPFQGHQVSRHSIADLISRIVQAPGTHVRESLGIAEP